MQEQDDRGPGQRQFTFVSDWQSMEAADGEALIEFWLREHALADAERARERLAQVVLHARDASGAIAAVCTAYPALLPQIGQPMYHYRCFVGARWRASKLARSMLVHAIRCLEAYASTRDYPCVGIVIELENQRFREAMADVPVWHGLGVRLVFIGRSHRGFDLRIQYFRGARLKRIDLAASAPARENA